MLWIWTLLCECVCDVIKFIKHGKSKNLKPNTPSGFTLPFKQGNLSDNECFSWENIKTKSLAISDSTQILSEKSSTMILFHKFKHDHNRTGHKQVHAVEKARSIQLHAHSNHDKNATPAREFEHQQPLPSFQHFWILNVTWSLFIFEFSAA